ncbi:MAG: hypothetical protein ABSF33_09995 [Acidimicrobiales bacterium]|jgi:hypothetical protein
MTALVLYAASSVLVIWVIVDVARRPSEAMTPVRRAAWIAGSVLGWLFFGLIGAVIAVVYLLGPRRRLNSSRH